MKCCPEEPGRHGGGGGGGPSMKQNRGASPWGLSATNWAAAVVAAVQVLRAESSLPLQDRWMLQAAPYPKTVCARGICEKVESVCAGPGTWPIRCRRAGSEPTRQGHPWHLVRCECGGAAWGPVWNDLSIATKRHKTMHTHLCHA